MKIMKMVIQEFEKGNIILFYSCKYKRRLNFNKKPKYKRVDFNIMKYDCRTDKGKIGIIVYFEPRDKYPYSYDRVILDTEGYKRTTRNIIKCSPNIIDLIEVGDYVNGLKVDKKYKDRVVINTRDEIIVWFEYQIKTIVTKEQFESMEYKVGE